MPPILEVAAIMKSKSILPYVSKPGRYLGKEFNAIQKDWDKATIRFALAFPDLYEIGMSHQGLQILYHIINMQSDFLAERCFSPDIDAEKFMRENDIELLSIESSQPLNKFDVLGITLPYELCYTNIVTLLKLGGIPLYSTDRNDKHPLVLGGGSCSLNPEPVADFFDAILLGDGEEGITDIAVTLKKCKQLQLSRAETLNNLAKIKGVYIPSHFCVQYDSENKIKNIFTKGGSPDTVERRILSDLDNTEHLCTPLVPNAKIVHDRLGIEIARGCTRGCRFCQAGMIYRPVRERSVDQILELAEKGIGTSGFEELALLSLSTGDYSCIENLLPKLMDNYAEDYVSVSMPSMRVGTLSQSVMDQIKRVRKTGFTVAPEAGSERLRQVINKGITEEDLLTTCKDAFSLGWNAIKLYFMIGLPTETVEDIEAIAELSLKTKQMASTSGGKRKQVTTSVGTFVPKPHTPFQWERQLSLEESRERITHLKQVMPRKGCKLKYHDPEVSFLEGVFSRGDRRLSRLIEEAWNRGARLDGWSDYFSLNLWKDAADKCGIDMADYLRARSQSEILPWQHLSSGIETSFLTDELEKAHAGTYTPDCRYNGCQQCGLCDFDTIRPVVRNEEKEPAQFSDRNNFKETTKNGNESHFKYMVSYARKGDISYLGHLEILQLLFRTLRRANIKTNFSKGFNPSPKISFGGALPVGMESEAEFFIMDLPDPLTSTSTVIEQLNSCLPPGILITDIALHSGNIPQSTLNFYKVDLPRELTESETEAIKQYLNTDMFFVARQRKGKTKEVDIRPLIENMAKVNGKTLSFQIRSTAGTPGVKIQEALSQIFSMPQEDILESKILKTSWQQL